MQRIHIFKAGKQTASNGAQIDFTEADLAATAAAYNPALHEAPIVVGHPANDDPAFGWVSGVKAEGANLFAEPHQVNAEFAEQVKSAAYKKVSASLYPKDHPHNPVPGVFYLRHVGFLGAMPPAIKGLKATEFAEDATCIELELDFNEAEAAPAGQAEWKFPTPQPTPQPTTKTDPAEPSSLPSGSDPTKVADGSPEGSPPATIPTSMETTTVTPEEAQALQARAEKLEADLAAAQTTLRGQAAAANTAAHVAFAETLVGEARLTEAEKAFVVATLDHLEPPVLAGDQNAPALVEFGEGDAKKPMAEAFKEWLKALPKRVEFGEQASRERAAKEGEQEQGSAVEYAEGTPQELIDLDTRIRKHAIDHKLSYAEAATVVAAQR